MAAASQVFQHKRERDDCWNGGLPLQDTKRINCGLTAARDSDLMAFFDQIDNFDANDSNPEGTDAANELEICEIGMNGVLKSLEDEFGLKVQTEKIEWIDEKGDADRVGSIKQDKFTEYGSNSEATSAWDIGDWTYYDDLRAELRYFVEDISPQDLGFIIDNYTFGDSTYDIMYLTQFTPMLRQQTISLRLCGTMIFGSGMNIQSFEMILNHHSKKKLDW